MIIANRRERLTALFQCLTLDRNNEEPTAMPTANTTGEQIIEAAVAGPDEANRLFTITGTANVGIFVSNGQSRTETWTFPVGPIFTRGQLYRAIGTASLSAQNLNVQTAPASSQFSITSVEADWDDESGRVEVRVEVFLTASASANVSINGLRYWVTVLAQV
jgi:hypothetical protein